MIIGRSVEDLTYDMILKEIETQARQGIDYFTVHAGVRMSHLPFVRKRLIGIVSRGLVIRSFIRMWWWRT